MDVEKNKSRSWEGRRKETGIGEKKEAKLMGLVTLFHLLIPDSEAMWLTASTLESGRLVVRF